MVRIMVKTVGMLLPLLTDVIVQGQPLERLEPFGTVVSQRKLRSSGAK
jgi:hypothetical protein